LAKAESARRATHCAPQHGRFDLVRRQHERRQIEARIQHIADPGFAADRHALAHKVGDVAIDRAFGSFEFGRELVRRDRPARAPQHLDDLE
jgi:hypothetical protein